MQGVGEGTAAAVPGVRKRRVGDCGADSRCGIAGPWQCHAIYAVKDICGGPYDAGRKAQVNLDCAARNGEYAPNSLTLDLLHMKHATDRGTKRYAHECIARELL